MQKGRRLTGEERAEAEKMFLTGKRFEEIAKFFSVTPSAIRVFLNKLGYKAHFYGKLTDKMKREILFDFDNGEKNFVVLAKKNGITPQSIKYFLNKEGRFARKFCDIQRKYSIDENYFENIDSPDKAYILGLLYADGCNYPKNNKITISLKKSDKIILEKIRNIIQPTKPIYFRDSYEFIQNGKVVRASGHYTITFISKKMSDDLLRHGVLPKKSLNISFPEFLDKDLTRHFIRGFFDGDGCISRRGRVIFSANKEFLIPLQEILIREGFCKKSIISKNIKSEMCSFTFGGREKISQFYKWMYSEAELFLDRKKIKMLDFCL